MEIDKRYFSLVQFFLAKYVKNNHISLIKPGSGSRFWKMVLSYVLDILKNSRWRIKNGDISFWRDPWLENGPLCDSSDCPTLRVNDCKLDDGWDIDLIQRLLGIEKL